MSVPPEDFRLLAGVIAAHAGREVVGRTRLQKEVMLLQRLGLPTSYSYSIHFYGPYSDGLNAELRLLRDLGLLEERAEVSAATGNEYYILSAPADAERPEVAPFLRWIRRFEQEKDPVVLELAATYDAFRADADHATAVRRLRDKKGRKCGGGREGKALDLLRELGLPVEGDGSGTDFSPTHAMDGRTAPVV